MGLTRKLAQQLGVSRAEAADQLDRVVADILRNLRNGQPAKLPGLGDLRQGPASHFEFDTKDKQRGE